MRVHQAGAQPVQRPWGWNGPEGAGIIGEGGDEGAGEARSCEPAILQPALHLGRCLEETGPREGSRLPNPEAQPGLPAPSGGLRNLRLVGHSARGGQGRGCQACRLQAAASPPQPPAQLVPIC